MKTQITRAPSRRRQRRWPLFLLLAAALVNRNYFAQPDTQVSAHFLVGLDGEVIQCIPLEEKSSATNERNRDTISIEVCHPDTWTQFLADVAAA